MPSDLRNQLGIPIDKFIYELATGEHGWVFLRVTWSHAEDTVLCLSGLALNLITELYMLLQKNRQKTWERQWINSVLIPKNNEQNGSLILIRGEELYKNTEKNDLELCKKSKKCCG